MYRMLDIAFPEISEILIADALALDSKAIGLYIVNNSVPGSVQSSSYAGDVARAGIGVLPIITPGNYPQQSPAQLLDALAAWGVPSGSAVAFDIERYSEPSGGWLYGAVTALQDAGYPCGMYGPYSDQNTYSGVPFQWRWLAFWTFIEAEPPAGYDAWQWTDQATGPSGTRYDMSSVIDSRLFWGMALTVPPVDPLPKTYPYRRQHMKYVHWNTQQQLFRIKQDGTLVQAVNDGAGHWAQFELGVGYVPGALDVAVLDDTQLQVYALNPDGSVAHFWQDANGTTWNTETIANA